MAMPVPLPPAGEAARRHAVPARDTARRYAPLSPLADGGSATVWKALDLRLGRVVALKRLHPALAADELAAARFEHEVATQASLSHPNVATVLDAGEDDDGPFLVMELIAGETLRDLVAREGALPAEQAVAIVTAVAAALDHAHGRDVVHRDVKPANVLIEDGTGRVVLTDFGIATSPDPVSRLTRGGLVVGTVDYMAPERGVGHPGTPASDVYALGVILYELLTGRLLFAGDTPLAVALAHQTDAPVPPGDLAPIGPALEAAVLRAIAKSPEWRQPSAAALAAELADAIAPAAPPPARSWRRATRRFLSTPAGRGTAAAWAAAGSMATYLLLTLAG